MFVRNSIVCFLLWVFTTVISQSAGATPVKYSKKPICRLTSDTLNRRLEFYVEWPERDIRLSLLKIPASEFQMGSEKGDPDEKPVHTVYLDTFWIGKYEVTACQFALFLNAIGQDRWEGHIYLDTDAPGALIHRTHSGFQSLPGFGDFPAAGVSWYGAKAYCDWLKKETGLPFNLPTEAQWEKAAHGKNDKERIFPWGVRLNKRLARYRDKQPTRVGSYPEGISPFGVFNMAGNIAEWVRDWYAKDYYVQSPRRNPTGPTTGTLKILRGGDWTAQMFTIPHLRSADRNPHPPASMNLTMGFRVVLEGSLPEKAPASPGVKTRN